MKSRKNKKPPRFAQTETPAVEGLTVCWVLTILMSTLFIIGSIATRWLMTFYEETPRPFAVLLLLLFFAAQACGVICLLLTPFTWKLRKEKPPRSIVGFAVLVAVLPFVMVAINSNTHWLDFKPPPEEKPPQQAATPK